MPRCSVSEDDYGATSDEPKYGRTTIGEVEEKKRGYDKGGICLCGGELFTTNNHRLACYGPHPDVVVRSRTQSHGDQEHEVGNENITGK